MVARVENVNADVLRKCREQMALDITHVKKKIASIEDIEAGKKYPTFKQLDTLANLYQVPRWVFISSELPEKYDFTKSMPAFRHFADREPTGFSDPKIRSLLTKVQRFRNLVIEIQDELGEPTHAFNPPEPGKNIAEFAKIIRAWLDVNESIPFPEWKKKLEQKGIFIFMTSKYSGWSHIDKEQFRGLSVYHPILPIIVINSSDAKKAQSFTLLHELGHLVKEENALDGWEPHSKAEEKWCDELAGEILMPEELFSEEVSGRQIENIRDVEKLSEKFHSSSYACLVKLRTSGVISQEKYSELEKQLKAEYLKTQKRLKDQSRPIPRNRSKEAFEQYGQIYANVLFHAYNNKEIGLHKLCRAFELKRVSQIKQLEDRL